MATGDKHIRIVIIVIKSGPSAVICSFQDFEQEKSVKTEIFLASMINSKHVYLGGSLLFGPPNAYFLGSLDPPPPPPPGNRRAWQKSAIRLLNQ